MILKLRLKFFNSIFIFFLKKNFILSEKVNEKHPLNLVGSVLLTVVALEKWLTSASLGERWLGLADLFFLVSDRCRSTDLMPRQVAVALGRRSRTGAGEIARERRSACVAWTAPEQPRTAMEMAWVLFLFLLFIFFYFCIFFIGIIRCSRRTTNFVCI